MDKINNKNGDLIIKIIITRINLGVWGEGVQCHACTAYVRPKEVNFV